MAILSPLYTLILPFLFLTTLPIFLFASLTTILAFSLLFLRVLVVYIELALTIIPYWILGPQSLTLPPSFSQASSHSPSTTSPTSPSLYRNSGNTWSAVNAGGMGVRRRKRRGSGSSTLSATGSITPIPGENGTIINTGMGLNQSLGPNRDYEGVGGWRIEKDTGDGNGSDNEGAEGLWTRINSRLELPAEQHVRKHHRSLTAGSVMAGGSGGGMGGKKRVERSYSPEALFMMNTSRTRTSPGGMTTTAGAGTVGGGLGEGAGYFRQVSPSRKRTSSVNTGSSGSSKAESVLSMMQR
ncbi:uncharacterized protein RAG0_06414 [Rhynchosporium agropyri]|uniref:Uncharacterized protein n=1 Tax=Rhynchosporium agropyri TaxID=914238 RepID=A0A1E1KGR4_9HELO|nr:uncharacterized protein RAG0_06414 [Rhynchosporium agropyri]